MSATTSTISEHDLVALKSAILDRSLMAGQTGTVVFVHADGGPFEVEFLLDPRRSVVVTVQADQLLKLHGLPVAVAG